jgi:hypothetical protein
MILFYLWNLGNAMVEVFTALLGSVPLDVPFEAEQATRPTQKGAIGGRVAS